MLYESSHLAEHSNDMCESLSTFVNHGCINVAAIYGGWPEGQKCECWNN